MSFNPTHIVSKALEVAPTGTKRPLEGQVASLIVGVLAERFVRVVPKLGVIVCPLFRRAALRHRAAVRHRVGSSATIDGLEQLIRNREHPCRRTE